MSGQTNYKISSITEESPIKAITESDAVYSFGEDFAVVPMVETTIATLEVLPNQTVLIKFVQGESMTDTVFRLYVNGTKVWQGNTAWTDRNVHGSILVKALENEVVALKVEHSATTNHPVSGGIYAVDITSIKG